MNTRTYTHTANKNKFKNLNLDKFKDLANAAFNTCCLSLRENGRRAWSVVLIGEKSDCEVHSSSVSPRVRQCQWRGSHTPVSSCFEVVHLSCCLESVFYLKHGHSSGSICSETTKGDLEELLKTLSFWISYGNCNVFGKCLLCFFFT